VKEINTENYIPFAADNCLVLTDPRYTFSQEDTLHGIVWVTPAAESPELFLEKINAETVKVKITPEEQSNRDQPLKFQQPLKEIKDGNYRLIVKTGEGQTTTLVEKIHILPFYIKVTKPYAIEKAELAGARYNYIFVQGQQYLEAGNVDQAVAYFRQIPANLWNAASIPIIARAFYKKGDYAGVMALLEKEEVKKEYPILLMLANSSIELKLYPKALEYLEKIRKYGETEEIDHLLAATYLNMGNRDKAMKYYERARTLKNKPGEPGEQKEKETTGTQSQKGKGEKNE
jgi:tetratricopeptide (TPR) repeat protein